MNDLPSITRQSPTTRAIARLEEIRQVLESGAVRRADVLRRVTAAIAELTSINKISVGIGGQFTTVTDNEPWRTSEESSFPAFSDQQLVARDACRRHDRVKIVSLAGGGKTTLLRAIATDHPCRTLYLAFNKEIARYASSVFPRHVEARTSHALALAALGSRWVDNEKEFRSVTLREVALLLGIPLDRRGRLLAWHVREAFDRYCASNDEDVSLKHLAPSARGGDSSIAKASGFGDGEIIIRGAQELWDLSTSRRTKVAMSHDAYLKLWSMNDPRIDADLILFDEFQDTSPVMMKILENNSESKQIVVGDPWQSIYQWRGAINAMDLVDFPTYTMTKTFRFGPAIADVANAILKARGSKDFVEGCGPSDSEVGSIASQDRHAVICRTNAGLCVAAARLPSTTSVSVIGGADRMIELLRSTLALYDGEIEKVRYPSLKQFGSFRDLADFAERTQDSECTMVVSLISRYKAEMPSMLEALSRSSVPADEATVTLTTAHAAKGREFDNVRLANDFKMLLRPDGSAPTNVAQELNLLYVAATRAKHKLETNDAVEQIISPKGPELDPDVLSIIDQSTADIISHFRP